MVFYVRLLVMIKSVSRARRGTGARAPRARAGRGPAARARRSLISILNFSDFGRSAVKMTILRRRLRHFAEC